MKLRVGGKKGRIDGFISRVTPMMRLLKGNILTERTGQYEQALPADLLLYMYS